MAIAPGAIAPSTTRRRCVHQRPALAFHLRDTGILQVEYDVFARSAKWRDCEPARLRFNCAVVYGLGDSKLPIVPLVTLQGRFIRKPAFLLATVALQKARYSQIDKVASPREPISAYKIKYLDAVFRHVPVILPVCGLGHSFDRLRVVLWRLIDKRTASVLVTRRRP